jgi:hypothetical protein
MTANSIARWLVVGCVAASCGVVFAQTDSPKQRRPPDAETAGQAKPREAPPPQKAVPRPQPQPPPRAVPPRYYEQPRAYFFPPVSLVRGYYYHPYFGFYYGPYYGPFYPFPGPHVFHLPYNGSAVRLRVKPVETEVYVNGYFAGIVDDFDGVFQRLYLPSGGHQIELRLDGYCNQLQKVYVPPGDTLEITHRMEPLGEGETAGPPSPPQPLDREWTSVAPAEDERPPSPFGFLAIRVEPADAQIFVDNEAWVALEGRGELLMHIEAGWHQLEIRKDGYQTFRTDIELSAGVTTRLNVKLVR